MKFFHDHIRDHTDRRKISENALKARDETQTGTFAQSRRTVRPDLREEVRRRGINGLYHFTRLDNLSSILRSGLVTRQRIDKGEFEAFVNDEFRLEKCRKSICCSIGFPNYKMFYKLRKATPDAGGWVVLDIDESVLWEKPCSFYPSNAASKEFKDRYVTDFTSAQAFRVLFDQIIGHPSRENLGLSPGWPTNPQAEVLVRSDIERDYIRGIFFEHQSQTDGWSSFAGDLSIAKNPDLYRQRHDYNYW